MQPQARVRKMRPPHSDRERAREMRQEPRAPLHYVSVEAWAPDTGASYPMQVPEHHTAMTPDPRAFETAVRDSLPPGWTGYLTGHNRFRCIPAHPGRN
jgi:hypothetical protein